MKLITNRTNPQTTWGRTDLDRIVDAVNEIAQTLTAIGIDNNVQAKTVWELITYIDELDELRESINELASLVGLTDTCPSFQRLTLASANGIEALLEKIINKIGRYNFNYCGAAYCTE